MEGEGKGELEVRVLEGFHEGRLEGVVRHQQRQPWGSHTPEGATGSAGINGGGGEAWGMATAPRSFC